MDDRSLGGGGEFARERGAILLIVEMIVIVLLIVAGIAIDGTIMAASKAQRQRVAEYVALEALQTYNRTDGAFNVKLEAARQRAEAIAQINVYISKPFGSDPTATDSLGTNSATTSPGSRNGVIFPGEWYQATPSDCASAPTPCPCDASGEWVGPCFRELDLDADPSAIPTAFKVELNLPLDSPFAGIFSRVQGPQAFDLAAFAIATAIPRSGVFLVDLSRSSHYETHIPFEGAGANAKFSAESSFYVTDQTCPSDTSNPCLVQHSCTIRGGPYPDTPAPPIVPIYTGLYDYIWENQGSSSLRTLTSVSPATPWQRPTAALSDVRKHYRSDYGCYHVTYTDGANPSQTANYLVDRHVGLNGTVPYDGPEPLTSMLYGVHEAFNLMQDHKIPGDGLGLIGFDISAKIQQRRFDISAPGSATYSTVQEITDLAAPTGSPSQTKRIRDHLFFIRHDAQANYPEALLEAVSMLEAAPTLGQRRDFVAVLGDGIPSCDLGRVCGGSEDDFNYAFNQLEDIVLTRFEPSNIQLHMMLIGDHVRPHNVLAKSHVAADRCMDDREARSLTDALNFVDVDNDADSGASWEEGLTLRPGKYFYGANKFYKLVSSTQGLWGPIRAPCLKAGVPADVRAELDAACAAATSGVRMDSLGNPTVQPLPAVVSPDYTDSDGRLFCDPTGSTKREQIHDFVRNVIGGSPYVLVSSPQ